MDDLFFRFDTFEEEIARKRRSSEILPAKLFDQLLGLMEFRFGFLDMQRVHSIGSLLMDYFTRNDDLQYLNHPIRVAASFIGYLPEASADEGVLALVHNLFERTGGVGAPEINALAGPSVRSTICLLNIDRKCERDPQYLAKYYADIQRVGRPITVLKALDKLDNLLEWIHRPVDPFYYEVIRLHVCPLLAEEDIRLCRYLTGLESYVRTRAPLWESMDRAS